VGKRGGFTIAGLVAAVAIIGAFLFLHTRRGPDNLLTLYGNVYIREVQVAFNDSVRIARMFVQEGDFVPCGAEPYPAKPRARSTPLLTLQRRRFCHHAAGCSMPLRHLASLSCPRQRLALHPASESAPTPGLEGRMTQYLLPLA
jgi:hypothetical protein